MCKDGQFFQRWSHLLNPVTLLRCHLLLRYHLTFKAQNFTIRLRSFWILRFKIYTHRHNYTRLQVGSNLRTDP